MAEPESTDLASCQQLGERRHRELTDILNKALRAEPESTDLASCQQLGERIYRELTDILDPDYIAKCNELQKSLIESKDGYDLPDISTQDEKSTQLTNSFDSTDDSLPPRYFYNEDIEVECVGPMSSQSRR